MWVTFEKSFFVGSINLTPTSGKNTFD